MSGGAGPPPDGLSARPVTGAAAGCPPLPSLSPQPQDRPGSAAARNSRESRRPACRRSAATSVRSDSISTACSGGPCPARARAQQLQTNRDFDGQPPRLAGVGRVAVILSLGSGCHMRCRCAASVRGMSPDCAGRAESHGGQNRACSVRGVSPDGLCVETRARHGRADVGQRPHIDPGSFRGCQCCPGAIFLRDPSSSSQAPSKDDPGTIPGCRCRPGHGEPYSPRVSIGFANPPREDVTAI